MSRWFRHYAGMCRDDKLVRAALRSRQTIERVVWIWTAILESASEINDGGRYEIDHAEIAYFLRCDEADVAGVESALGGLARVHEGVVARWSDRQFQSDRSADRTKRYRDRHRTDSDGAGDADVTSQGRHRDAPETETETEAKKEKKETPTATAEAATPPVLTVVETAPDFRRELFGRGLTAVMALTGKAAPPSRTLLGSWLKLANDEAVHVLAAIDAAAEAQPADPVPWIVAALRSRMMARDPPRKKWYSV